MAWTEERVELLKKLWTEGLSASQIARTLGDVTRNAVIGKVHRLGLSGRATPTRSDRPRIMARRKPAPKPILVESEPIEEVVLDDGEWATVLTLNERMCKWPIGHPGTDKFHFCGRGAAADTPYCEAHAKVAYQPSTSRRDRKRSVG
jgi:GcrA cell cycle regulator